MRHEPTLTVGNDPIDTPVDELICNIQAVDLYPRIVSARIHVRIANVQSKA